MSENKKKESEKETNSDSRGINELTRKEEKIIKDYAKALYYIFH